MVFSDDEDETKQYIVKEFREMMAKEALDKAKVDSDLNDRLNKIEMYMNDLGSKAPLGEPSVNHPSEPLAPGEVGIEDAMPLEQVVPQSPQSLIVNFLLCTLNLIPSCLILIIRDPLPMYAYNGFFVS
jgi:hypothetical protein